MQKHWQYIIEQIEQKYNITQFQEWLVKNKEALRKLQKAIEESVKKGIINNSSIAKEFIDKSSINQFLSLKYEEKEKELEKLVSSNLNLFVNPKIDERTLQKLLSTKMLPVHRKHRNCFSILVFNQPFDQSYLQREPYYEDLLSENNAKKLSQFHETYWWAFYFHYEENSKIGKLGRAILVIKNENNVFLKNVNSETSTDYEGRMILENSHQHLYFDLTAINTKEKHLRITIFKGVGRVYSLMVGVYTNIYSTNSMAAGSILLQQIPNPEKVELEGCSFTFEEAIEGGIHPAIIKFFEKREKNFIKSPSNLLTLDKLTDWVEIQQKRG